MKIGLGWKYFLIIASLLLLIACGGSGESENIVPENQFTNDGNSNNDSDSSTADDNNTIDSQGGTIQHEDGVRIEIPEGAVDSPSQFSISKVDLPQILPGDISYNNDVYEVLFDGV